MLPTRMRLPLKLHPDYKCAAATSIEVEVSRPAPGRLQIRYSVSGILADLSIPTETAPTRADGLWRHTCFEIFIRAAPDAAYHEFNFAPSTQWAAYRFDSHRRGMSDVEIAAPPIDSRSTASSYQLTTSLDLTHLPGLSADARWTLGLSAVIEDADGRRSYWALAHPQGGADFHHSDCFAAKLAPPEPA